MEEAKANVPEPLRKWIASVWNAIAKRKSVNRKFVQDMGPVAEKTQTAVRQLYGRTVSKQIITPKDLEHIYVQHGRNPQKELADEQIPMTAELAAMIPDVLAAPDFVEQGTHETAGNNPTILLSKEYVDGTIRVVEAVLKNNILEVWTAYAWNASKTEKKTEKKR
jgi:hypothetical protein